MHLSVAVAAPVGQQHQGGVEDLVAVGLQGAAHDRHAVRLGQSVERPLGDGLRLARHGQRLGQRGEGVARDGGLGEHGEGGAGGGGLADDARDEVEVGLDLTELGIDLAGGDLDRHRRILPVAAHHGLSNVWQMS